jgi:ABC-type transport system involved in cytochrome c biogenesis permease component
MFTKPEPTRHFPSGLLWWVIAFAAAMALSELWMGDYGDGAFQATLVLLLVVQAMTEGRPVGWFRVAHWSLVILMASLLVVRVMRWRGFL